MIDITQVKKFPVYGTSYSEKCLWKLNKEFTATTCIQDMSWLSVCYFYPTEENTYLEETAEIVSKKKFYELVNQVKEKYKVDFTIK